MKVDYWVQNPFDKTYSFEMVLSGIDEKGEMVSLNVVTLWDVMPGQKKYDTSYIDKHPNLSSCKIQFQELK